MDKTLKYLIDFGVDENIENSPVNHYLPLKQKEKDTTFSGNVTQTNKNILVSPKEIMQKTYELAKNCSNLKDLENAVKNFKDISITKTATNVVFSAGNPNSKIMIIGEAPGADEDAKGIPFCGASGQLLDQIFSYIDLSREKNIYITNTLFWRPPGNRKPTPEELEICRPFLEKHIALINPKLIILVGGTAVSAVLNIKQGISKIRGSYYDYENDFLQNSIKTTAVFHPSYLLRSPGQKKKMWLDCLNLRKYLRESSII